MLTETCGCEQHSGKHKAIMTTPNISHADTSNSVLSLTLTSGDRQCKLQTTVHSTTCRTSRSTVPNVYPYSLLPISCSYRSACMLKYDHLHLTTCCKTVY